MNYATFEPTMKRILQFLTLLLLVLMNTFGYAQVNFSELSYADALKTAQAEDKMVFLDFRADWCKPCIEMERTTFQDENLGLYMRSNFISLKIDVDQFTGMDLREKFNVNQYPTMLIIDPRNEEVQLRMIGFKPARILIGDLEMMFDNMIVEDDAPIAVPESKQKEEPNSDVPKETPKKKKCFLIRWLDKITE